MVKPELFDVIELKVNLPEYGLHRGDRGAIVDCYPDDAYEVEFANNKGETKVLCVLTEGQFALVWKAATETWLKERHRVKRAT
jgi:hypothetical protein